MQAKLKQQQRDYVFSIPLEDIDVSDPSLFQSDTIDLYFERLRHQDPVHYKKDGMYGSFWSITKFNDILAVDKNYGVFSSEARLGGILIPDRGLHRQNFIAMDPPRHDEQRKAVAPIVAPANLTAFQSLIRSRAIETLDALPLNETFDWVDRVSRNLTTQMLATLFDFPFEDRHLLPYWSDLASVDLNAGTPITSEEIRDEWLQPCYAYFTKLWNERVNAPPKHDLISMLAHSEAGRNMTQREFYGNIILLIIGGNDTVRHSITGGLLALNQNPAEYQKLRNNPGLIPNMVSEIIRWQTPLAHMRRTAVADIELGGKQIKAGDKVVMWYLSGNRDEEVIENPDQFLIDRKNARHHLSFGFGVHRCVGNRLAELQLTILWEEIMKRYQFIEVMGEPVRIYSNSTHGFESMPVRIRK